MEPLLIDTADVYHSVTVSKSRFKRFREYADKGWPLPPLPYFLTVAKAYGGAVTYTSVQKNISGSYFGEGTSTLTQHMGPVQPSESWWANANSYLQARFTEHAVGRDNKLLDKIKGSSLPLIMMYRERHRTGDLILRFLDNTIFTLSNFKRPKRILDRWGYAYSANSELLKRLRRIGRSRMSLSNKLLEYRFAWTPLYYDIVESLKAAENAEKKFNVFSRNTGNSFKYEYTAQSSSNVKPAVISGTREGWYGISVKYTITDITLAGLGMIMDVPTTLWDGIQFSFVLDRFVDISSYLDRMNATIGTEFTSGYSTAFWKQTVKKSTPEVSVSYLKNGRDRASITYTTTDNRPPREDLYMKRTVLTNFPKPVLEYPAKNWKLVHIADYIALIRQRLRSR